MVAARAIVARRRAGGTCGRDACRRTVRSVSDRGNEPETRGGRRRASAGSKTIEAAAAAHPRRRRKEFGLLRGGRRAATRDAPAREATMARGTAMAAEVAAMWMSEATRIDRGDDHAR